MTFDMATTELFAFPNFPFDYVVLNLDNALERRIMRNTRAVESSSGNTPYPQAAYGR
jgi:hypothetical protein